MSRGLPCVVSDAPGVAQLIEHERHGLVVPAGDAEATAAALVRVLSNPDMAKAFGAAARQRVLQSFSSPVVAANHERMYLEMLTTES